jgi:hypothetical protein
MIFTFNGFSYMLPRESYILHSEIKGACAFKMSTLSGGSMENIWILGLSFFQNYYTVFDQDKLRIGFAVSKGANPKVIEFHQNSPLFMKNETTDNALPQFLQDTADSTNSLFEEQKRTPVDEVSVQSSSLIILIAAISTLALLFCYKSISSNVPLRTKIWDKIRGFVSQDHQSDKKYNPESSRPLLM